MKANLCAIGASATLSALASGQNTIYVNGACGNDDWTGLSEVCAAPDGPKKTIGWATAIASPGDTVLVAPGTYSMKENAFGVYRAFAVRSIAGPFQTILDGEFDERVIEVFGFGGGPGVIEGFTLKHVDTFQAGPIYVAEADLTLVNCRFIENSALFCGAVYMDSSSGNTVKAYNCVFERNSATGIGAILAADLEVAGCTFIDNIDLGNGASCIAGSNSITVTGSIFTGEIPFIYGDGPVTYCNVQGGLAGEGNIDADSMFADPAAGDYRLLPGSPCIDAGSNPAFPEWVRTDIGGLERFIDDPATVDTGLGSAPIADIGAHEFQPACYADFTADGLLDLFDFLAYVNAFNAGDIDADCDHSGFLDLFDFLCFVNAFNAGC